MNNPQLRIIPIDRIEILNPRDRNNLIFEDIVGNIKKIGLKKPIVVTPRSGPDGTERFLLVCGEGRLKAFTSLGESTIPALVVDVSDEDALIMSLAENIARRQHRPLELLAGIRQLSAQGYSSKEIAEKTGLTQWYVRGILNLLSHGEERLLVAVEQGRVPLNTALDIVGAGDSDEAVQEALQTAYESGKLRGRQLIDARRVIERRKTLGRSASRSAPRGNSNVSASSLVRSYQREVERQRAIVRKAEFTQQRLLFLVGALRQLFSDENFVNLLRAEGLATLPKYLADRVWPSGSTG
ncbi:plasmid partitioning protein RepB C-terminal domain-containing protein [Pandoraea pneumonica]|uniref:ParB/RepB/Spo0J family partition protein n=1 Tax=Pandoraea commovens TaxID=2508289 RepID=A0ABY5QFI3_9BURK|nr:MULTISPECIES: plasmid partitioning protein RepB C-terminal domain-containing protein [Pandoraea]UVA79562.1 ParB/RepB/Spo0J family partition protein [Pandoraea commovens]VVE80359.1 putative chromosome-partitioning protein ParB [Pandoraea sputorum]